MPEDFLSAFLADNPGMLFQAMRPQALSYGSNFLDYWRGQQGNVWGDYLGLLGKEALGGNVPNLSYQSFLGNYPWLQRWFQMSPEERGERPSLFAPRLRWMM